MTTVSKNEVQSQRKPKSKPFTGGAERGYRAYDSLQPPSPARQEYLKSLQDAENANDGGFSRAVAESEEAVKQGNREDNALQKFDNFLYERRLDREAGFKKGGTVRGAGCAIRGVKKCKMR